MLLTTPEHAIIGGMAKKKTTTEAARKPGRPKTDLTESRSYLFTPDHIEGLTEYRLASAVPPKEADVVRKAVEEFLERNGLWPRKR